MGPIQLEDTFAINSHGQIVGSNFFAAVDQGIKPAWVWAHGRRTPIKPQQGYECVIGCTINDRGEVAGNWATTSDGATLSVEHRAFIWQAGKFRDLAAILNSPYSEAAGITSSGSVAGIVAGSDRPVEDDPSLTALRAFLFPGKRGSVQFLGPGRAEALNDREQVVGEDGLEAVEWMQGRKRKLGVQGRSVAVNSRGQILINGRGPGFNRPLLWQNGRARPLPVPAGTNATAYALNEAGDVVGERSTEDQISRALLWRGGHVYDLNTLLPPHSGWVLETTTGINVRGQIVGRGKHDGKPRAYLLTSHGK